MALNKTTFFKNLLYSSQNVILFIITHVFVFLRVFVLQDLGDIVPA